MKNFISTFLEYFLHDSTWKGLIGIATAAGVVLKPELQGAIVALGLATAGFINVFITDSDVTKTIEK